MSAGFVGAGAIQYVTGTSATVPYPAGASTDAILVLIASKDDTASVGTPIGYQDLGAAVLTAADAPAATGIDVGPVRISARWSANNPGTAAGSVSVTDISSNVSWLQAIRVSRGAGEAWQTPEITVLRDAAGGTAWAATDAGSGSTEWAAGDLLVSGIVLPTDTNPTWPNLTHTLSGVTVGTPTLIGTASTTSQRDLGGRSYYASVSGSGTGVMTTSGTLSGTTTNAYGAQIILRVRSVSAPSAPGTPTVAPSATAEAVAVSWSAVAGASQYEIDYSTDGGGAWASATIGFFGTSYTHTGRNPTLSYTYRLRAVNAAGTSTSGPASSAVSPNPSPPSWQGVIKGNGPELTIQFNSRSYVATYKVYRRETLVGGAYTLVGTTPSYSAAAARTFTDNVGLEVGKSYDYQLTTVVSTPTSRESGPDTTLNVVPEWSVSLNPSSGDDAMLTDYEGGGIASVFSSTSTSQQAGFSWYSTGAVYQKKVAFIRFPLAIPQGATIDSATLQLPGFNTFSSVDDLHLRVRALKSDNAAMPTDVASAQAIIPVAGLTTAFYEETFETGGSTSTPTEVITGVIQEIVNRPGWVSGNYVMLVIQDERGTWPSDTNDRFAQWTSRNGSSTAQPVYVKYTPQNLGEVHTTSGSATGIRSTTFATSKRAITAGNATGIRSTTAVTVHPHPTTGNATGIRGVTAVTTTLRTTTGNATGIRSTTAVTGKPPEIHTTTGSATGLRGVTAATTTKRTTSGSTQRTGSVTFLDTTVRTTTGNAAGVRSTTAVTVHPHPTTGSATGIRSVTAVTTTRRTTTGNAAGIRSTTRTGSSTRTTTGQMVSVHTTTSEVIGAGEQHFTTGSATGVRGATSVTSRVAQPAGSATGVRSTTSVSSRRAVTAANAAGVRSTTGATTTRRTTSTSASQSHGVTAVVSGVHGAVGGTAQAQRGALADVTTTRATEANTSPLVAGVVEDVTTTRTTAGQAVSVHTTTYILGPSTIDTLLDGTAVLATEGPAQATSVAVPAGPAEVSLVARPPATATLVAAGPSTVTLVVRAPAQALVEPGVPSTAILEPSAASAATIERE